MEKNNIKIGFYKITTLFMWIICVLSVFYGVLDCFYSYQSQYYLDVFFKVFFILSFLLVSYGLIKKSINKKSNLKIILLGSILFSISFISLTLYCSFPFKNNNEAGIIIILMIIPFSLLLGATLDLIKSSELNTTKKFFLLGSNLSFILLCLFTLGLYCYLLFLKNNDYNLLFELPNIFNVFIFAVLVAFFIASALSFIRKQFKISIIYSILFMMIDIFATQIKLAFFS